MEQDETVTLEIQGTPLICSRVDLIEHSDYFKAMFEGNFIESCKNVIPLNGVELDAMKIILKLLWDCEYVIDEENILSVLEAACMLQFLQVKNTCLNQLLNILSVDNCLKIWTYTEHLGLQEISCKAKLKALLEFVLVKDTYFFLELSLEEVVKYLGNVNLQCVDESQVFESVIKWFEHCGEQSAEVLIKLLFCVDFSSVELEILDKFSVNHNISKFEGVSDVLKCVMALKNGGNCDNVQKQSVEYACGLLKSKKRNLSGQPCILMQNVEQNGAGTQTILYYDNFKRKRRYGAIDSCSASVVAFDVDKRSFRKLFEIETFKSENLSGFKITGYKQLIFLYGGEFLLGKGTWNSDFYIYDTITEKWEKKKFPFRRRHFESYVCGKYLYVIGGTGPFRVIQENIFWYDIDEGVWSDEVSLPSSARQIKCCNFQNKLFLLDINNKNGYIFCSDSRKWKNLAIRDSANVLPFYSEKLILFSYKNSIYIKSPYYLNRNLKYKLFEMKIEDDQLIVWNDHNLSDVFRCNSISQVESMVCNNILCSLNKHSYDEVKENEFISIELFNIDTHEGFGETKSEILDFNGEKFRFSTTLTLFSVFHTNSLERDERINC